MPTQSLARAVGLSLALGLTLTQVGACGSIEPVGDETDSDGALRFVPETAGQHTFVADVGGVRCLTPVFAQQRAGRWLLAVGSVPLGLALLWIQLRRIRRGMRTGQA